MQRSRQTKILATLGPATSDEFMIRKLVEAGADAFRINFSHGKPEEHAFRIEAIRRVEQQVGRIISVVADLQGPKLRIGQIEGGELAIGPGQSLCFDLNPEPGNAERIPLPHPEIIQALEVGHGLLLDDGRVRVRVTEATDDYIKAEVIAGKVLSDRKGVNVPDAVLNLPALTEKDRNDLALALEMNVDWIALSFVQRPEDLAEARRLIAGRAALMVKVEKPSAVDYKDQLIELADGLMVARGDLGVECPPEKVPMIQKSLIRDARNLGKPVVVATQMLESMITSPMPTRAEASDVATAVYDGTDCVMLSAETAVGQYPIEAITMMDRIASSTERDPLYRPIMDADHPDPNHTAADAITSAAHQVAETIGASAIVTYTTTGSTSLRTARERPAVPIMCLTSEITTARRLALSYGIHAVTADDVTDEDSMIRTAIGLAKSEGLADIGSRVVITAGIPFGTPGNTNNLRIAWVN